MEIKVNKELLQNKINDIDGQINIMKETLGKLKGLNWIEGDGAVYEDISISTDVFIKKLDGSMTDFLSKIVTNLQTIHDDFENKEKEITTLINEDKKY